MAMFKNQLTKFLKIFQLAIVSQQNWIQHNTSQRSEQKELSNETYGFWAGIKMGLFSVKLNRHLLVIFMCQFVWAIKCSYIWSNIIPGVSVGMLLDEIYI